MVRIFKTIVIGFAILGGSLAADEASAAKASKTTPVQGTVYSVDAAGRTVTLKASDGTTTTLNVLRNSKLRRNQKKVTLSGLVLGDQANALYDASMNARQLSAAGVTVGTLQGGVLGVNSGSGVVHLTTGNFGTSAHTRIVRNGKISSLGSMTAHDHVTAHVTHGSALAPRILAVGTPEPGTAVDVQVEGPEEYEVQGTISAVDLDAKTVTITPEEDIAEVTVNVTAETLIALGDASATIADLTVGLVVEAVYDPATLNAYRIEAHSEEEEGYAEGPITAIDTVAGTITIDCYGAPVTLFVDASTKIVRNEEPAVFADLQIGDEAMAEYNTVTMVAKEIEVYVPEVPAAEPPPPSN